MLAEALRCSCDVPGEWESNREKYPGFDFSKVERFGNDWFLSNLTPELQQMIKAKAKEYGVSSHSELKTMLLELLKTKEVYESPTMLRARTELIKKGLEEYRKDHPVIVVVAHYCILGYLMAKEFDQHDNMAIHPTILNCHPHYTTLSSLLNSG
jgi:nucleoid-associated protein YejK